jgi:RHS repeat-associated protein
VWHFSYDGQEVVEERNGSEEVVQQYVYGPNHIDEPVMMRGTHGTFFVYQDANWNVIGTTTPGGDLAEEYNYTPYGRVLVKRHTAFGDADGDGDIDSADQSAWDATQGPGGTYDRDLDADYDGDNDTYDQTAFDNNKNAAGESIIVANRAWSPNANDLTFTARRLDPESMLMHYRWRAYSPTLKRFMQRDRLRYADGPSLYEYVLGNPLRYLDPSGRQTSVGGCYKSVAAFRTCLESGVLDMGEVSRKFVGDGKSLIRTLKRWGGRVVKGGKGSHTKIIMPNGKTVIVPVNPGPGTVKSIIEAAISGSWTRPPVIIPIPPADPLPNENPEPKNPDPPVPSPAPSEPCAEEERSGGGPCGGGIIGFPFFAILGGFVFFRAASNRNRPVSK